MARGKSAKERARIIERQTLALELRRDGWTYRAIGKKLDCTAVTAWRDVQVALKASLKLRDGEAEILRQLELERLDMMWRALEHFMAAGNIGSIMAGVRVMERRAKLLGLDAPASIDVTTGGQPFKTYISIEPGQAFGPDMWPDVPQPALNGEHVAADE